MKGSNDRKQKGEIERMKLQSLGLNNDFGRSDVDWEYWESGLDKSIPDNVTGFYVISQWKVGVLNGDNNNDEEEEEEELYPLLSDVVTKKATKDFGPGVGEKMLYDTFSAFGVIIQTPKVLINIPN
ncbi:hypothetical protein C1646_772922 [Rhizophagus diaphanus]|nr:hypothetical protein C1646_772922 [Rhizophagus diaphanus] [Rhizophagus sp. MUCL 43196]